MRDTVPVKPLTAVMVIVTLVLVPTVTFVGELATIVKPVTWNVAVAECDSDPVVPVMVRT